MYSFDHIPTFFRALADRFRKENDLSDITWALCEASPTFKGIWIRFFFGDELNPDDIDWIQREATSDDKGSRVDFLIKKKGGYEFYLIEVKIGDKNQHFGQYDSAYGLIPERIGYITNYPLKQEGNYRVRQWSAFCYELGKVDDVPATERDLFFGYREYLQRVCGIVMLTEKIDIEKMSALYRLTLLFEELTACQTDHYTSSFYKSLDRREVRWLYYSVKYVAFPEWSSQYPFVGIRYQDDEPCILGGFDKRAGWAREACDFLKKHKTFYSQVALQYCSLPYPKGGEWYFDLSADSMTALRNAATLKEQKAILKGFIEEVTMFPVRLAEVVGTVEGD